MAALHEMRNVIEPADGAAASVSAGDRGGVHTMWSSNEYRNVWWVVPLDSLGHDGVRDAGSIATARALLQRIKRHSDPVLRHYGWTVKHLKEHVGGPGGMCYHDNQGTADISLQLRVRPDKQCSSFRSFGCLMGVMIHEMARDAHARYTSPAPALPLTTEYRRLTTGHWPLATTHVADDGERGGGDGGAAQECKVAHRRAEGAREGECGDLLLRPLGLGEHVWLEGDGEEEEQDTAP